MVKLQTLKPIVRRLDVVPIRTITTQMQRITGRRLQETNARILEANPLCVMCQAVGRVSAAVEVDHIIPLHLGGADEDHNKQGLCKPCHDAKSAEEARGRAGQNFGGF